MIANFIAEIKMVSGLDGNGRRRGRRRRRKGRETFERNVHLRSPPTRAPAASPSRFVPFRKIERDETESEFSRKLKFI